LSSVAAKTCPRSRIPNACPARAAHTHRLPRLSRIRRRNSTAPALKAASSTRITVKVLTRGQRTGYVQDLCRDVELPRPHAARRRHRGHVRWRTGRRAADTCMSLPPHSRAQGSASSTAARQRQFRRFPRATASTERRNCACARVRDHCRGFGGSTCQGVRPI